MFVAEIRIANFVCCCARSLTVAKAAVDAMMWVLGACVVLACAAHATTSGVFAVTCGYVAEYYV